MERIVDNIVVGHLGQIYT